mmetsp:Transcript_4579/g.9348  ORF Transcript_4579/g.9348 Transcript_4579/m.9348 type:complete len:332 (-) Transcript_4579:236-1231(-)
MQRATKLRRAAQCQMVFWNAYWKPSELHHRKGQARCQKLCAPRRWLRLGAATWFSGSSRRTRPALFRLTVLPPPERLPPPRGGAPPADAGLPGAEAHGLHLRAPGPGQDGARHWRRRRVEPPPRAPREHVPLPQLRRQALPLEHDGGHAPEGRGEVPGPLEGPRLLPQGERERHPRKPNQRQTVRVDVHVALLLEQRGRLDQRGEEHGAQVLHLELRLRLPHDAAQLLAVAHLEGPDKDTADLQELVEVLRVGARARAEVDPVVAHGQVRVQLVDVPEGELDPTLAELAAAKRCVGERLRPDVNAIVDAGLSEQLSHKRAEIAGATANVQE